MHPFWLSLLGAAAASTSTSTCSSAPATLHLPDAPYDNFFYSDCHTAVQVVVTSPQADSDLTTVSPRFIVAWPAGNSGIAAYFAPQEGGNGSLSIQVVNSTVGSPLAAIYREDPSNASGIPYFGVTGTLRFNASASLTTPILGSIRTIRDFAEGPSVLQPRIQDAIKASSLPNGGAALQRLWLDNVTTTHLNFTPAASTDGSSVTVSSNGTLTFDAGDYVFSAEFNYPQLTQLSAAQVLSHASAPALIQNDPERTAALSFLSYSNKLVAGAWRFLTYFGRDSMISALLLEPVLSKGENSATEAVIAAVLERLNREDGSVCHEETIGDYATWLNEQNGVFSTDPQYDYKMIDSEYYLPILMNQYFVQNSVGQSRADSFSSITAGTINPANKGLTYGQLAVINAERTMSLAAPFAGYNNQTRENLLHLKDGQVVGQWRDSAYGIGGGRIPYDVNTALMPAALRAIASLARNGFFASHSQWATLADQYAQVWEEETLQFFHVRIPQFEAQQLVSTYADTINFPGPNQTDTIDDDVEFHALALDGYDNQSQVLVMNTDDCFRHFLLNTTTNETQLTAFVNQTANNIRRTFPAGLMTDAGMLISNPAYGTDPEYADNWTSGAYHGTVVWSWPLAMMAKGLEQQLARCESTTTETKKPEFCADSVVYNNVKQAYNTLWDSIEENTAQLSQEVWSWVYSSANDSFVATPLGVMPPGPGESRQTESDIRQLWSLTFLAVTRNTAFSS
ncbi:Leucine--tRNA ligase [Talaromyces islandicus]|uniref:Leucine--tRNA ligase n=1 Tax=Talaromyces islandicus TaxID=28573 RepID=A0A0U1LR11_TALIS|nr:Leucine--tRNA ligase [Talaromyces islandicus]